MDGDQAIVDSVNAMLKGMGRRVRTETSGADARDVFSSNQGGFDLVIADLGMPHISGFLLVKKLRKVRSHMTRTGAHGRVCTCLTDGIRDGRV